MNDNVHKREKESSVFQRVSRTQPPIESTFVTFLCKIVVNSNKNEIRLRKILTISSPSNHARKGREIDNCLRRFCSPCYSNHCTRSPMHMLLSYQPYVKRKGLQHVMGLVTKFIKVRGIRLDIAAVRANTTLLSICTYANFFIKIII